MNTISRLFPAKLILSILIMMFIYHMDGEIMDDHSPRVKHKLWINQKGYISHTLIIASDYFLIHLEKFKNYVIIHK